MRRIFVLALLTTSLYAYDGYQEYGQETVDSIQGNGLVILNGTKVTGPVRVSGELTADGATLSSLKVSGQASLTNCYVANAEISGGLDAYNTRFQDLTVTSQKIVLDKCGLNSLTVCKIDCYSDTQIVDIRGGACTGTIRFEGENGEIWVSNASEISQVVGAKVLHKDLTTKVEQGKK